MIPTHQPAIVCFDIGGVLVKIRHSWDAAVKATGREPGDKTYRPLDGIPRWSEYQNGELADEEFSERLGEWLGLTGREALEVHLAILDADYPGALDLVNDLKSQGVFTACFSNTNALHWARLESAEYHPAVASLEARFASHRLGLAKPDPQAFEAVENLLPPHGRIIFFDDTAVNVEAALNCGWHGVKVDPAADPPGQMRATLIELGVLKPL